jgi:hypothetical protein
MSPSPTPFRCPPFSGAPGRDWPVLGLGLGLRVRARVMVRIKVRVRVRVEG